MTFPSAVVLDYLELRLPASIERLLRGDGELTSQSVWQVGDRVRHGAKPEWGVGTVIKADSTSHEGKRCQRLSIKFARQGTKTISTAFAKLELAEERPKIDAARDPVKAALARPSKPAPDRSRRKPPPGMMGPAEEAPEQVAIDPSRAREIMTRVPDSAKDPFRSVAQRIDATFDLYKFRQSGGSLLDWASIQSGLDDPLTAFSRHDLEQLFDRFRINLNHHLTELLADARREGIDVRALTERAPQPAKTVLLDFTHRR